MAKNMTVWIVNLTLAAMTLAMFAFPSPSDLVDAFTTQSRAPRIDINPAPHDPQIELATYTGEISEPAVVVIEYDQAAECLNIYRTDGLKAVEGCMSGLVREVAAYDELMAPLVRSGKVVIPNPEIERKRLAVTRLCRAKWSATGGYRDGPEMRPCSSVIQGVEY